MSWHLRNFAQSIEHRFTILVVKAEYGMGGYDTTSTVAIRFARERGDLICKFYSLNFRGKDNIGVSEPGFMRISLLDLAPKPGLSTVTGILENLFGRVSECTLDDNEKFKLIHQTQRPIMHRGAQYDDKYYLSSADTILEAYDDLNMYNIYA